VQMLMSINMPASSPGQTTAPTQTIEAASGQTSMDCNWEMVFSDGTMNGVVQGTTSMSQVNNQEVALQGTMSVTVVAGTGSYAGLVGGGSWNQDQTISIGGTGPGAPGQPSGPPSGSGPTPPAGGPPTPPPPAAAHSLRSSMRALVASVAQASAASTSVKSTNHMKVSLRHGAIQAKIVAPGHTLALGSNASLRVASASRSQCQASATSAGRTVSLGTAVDRTGHGGVTFAGSLARELGAGAWQVKAICTYRAAGRRMTTAPAVESVTVGRSRLRPTLTAPSHKPHGTPATTARRRDWHPEPTHLNHRR
jgi:hypothetical protein